MAVVTVKSKTMTNRDAKTPAESRYSKALVKEFIGVCTLTTGDSIASKLQFGTIPSNSRVSSMQIFSPDIGTTTAFDLGLYDATANDGTAGGVVSASFFTPAVVVNAGAVDSKELAFGNVVTLANSEKMIWELLGLATDPGKDYDVVGTLTGAADAGGTVMLRGRFVV